jgi:hypothetical protein
LASVVGLGVALILAGSCAAQSGYSWFADKGGRAASFGIPGQATSLVRITCSPRRGLTLVTPLAVELRDGQRPRLELNSSFGRSSKPAEILDLADGAYLAVPLKIGDGFLTSLSKGQSVSLGQSGQQLDLPGSGASAAVGKVLKACRTRT